MKGNKGQERSLPRKIGITFGSIILSVFLISTVIIFSLVQITAPDIMKPLFSEVASKGLTGNMTSEQLNTVYSELVTYCNKTGNESAMLPIGQEVEEFPVNCSVLRSTKPENVNDIFPYPVALSTDDSKQIYNNLNNECNRTGNEIVYFQLRSNNNSISDLAIKCSDINATKPEDIGRLIGGTMFDSLYYAEPKCSYPGCFFKEKSGLEYFTIFLSAKAHDFYSMMFYVLLGLTAVTAAGVIALGKKWYAVARDFGISLIVAGLPFFGMSFIKSGIPQDVAAVIGSAADVMLQKLSNNFLLVLVIGAVLLALGLIGRKFSKEE